MGIANTSSVKTISSCGIPINSAAISGIPHQNDRSPYVHRIVHGKYFQGQADILVHGGNSLALEL